MHTLRRVLQVAIVIATALLIVFLHQSPSGLGAELDIILFGAVMLLVATLFLRGDDDIRHDAPTEVEHRERISQAGLWACGAAAAFLLAWQIFDHFEAVASGRGMRGMRAIGEIVGPRGLASLVAAWGVYALWRSYRFVWRHKG
ncbi:MAG: hypothetical protein QM803_15600 [Rhodocyclaceae bacterium]